MAESKSDFEAAVARAYPVLARAATVLCMSRSDAEDTVQETIARACKSYASFRGESSVTTWMYSILARVAAGVNRDRAKGASLDEAKPRLAALPPTDRKVLADERSRVVIDCIKSLPERQREIVTLYFLEDLSYAQVATALGVSVGTVKASMFKAKASMRSALAARGIREIGDVLSR